MSKESESQSPGPKFDEVYNDKDADVTLVSSDGIIFKVHKYYLQAHSPVFRDMLNIENENSIKNHQIEFTDHQIEDSFTLTIFLNAIYGRPLTLVQDSLGPFRNCIYLARKYECEVLLSILRTHATGFPSQGISPQYIFVIAAELDDINLAARSISDLGQWEWGSPEEGEVSTPPGWSTAQELQEQKAGKIDSVTGAGVMEVTSWAIWEFHRIPLPYMIGLMRTGRRFSLAQGSSEGPEASEYFKDLMVEWREKK